jgi:ElaB/YqjD/DUF883 family membrane-anchored ribosome-binding protein
MSAQLTVALVSAAVALVSILLSARVTNSNTKLQARLQADLTRVQDESQRKLAESQAESQRNLAELQARLNDELEQRRERATKASRLEQVVNRYRDPLLSAAFDLQSRIYNVVDGDFFVYLRSGDEDERNYVVYSTLFVIAEYLGWVEALRRGIQFLDLGDVKLNRDLAERLQQIRSIFSSDSLPPPFRIFRAEQRAIGELMLKPSSDEHSTDALWGSTGYASFCSKLEHEPSFAKWFSRLVRDIRELAAEPAPNPVRLIRLQNSLIDLINFLDDPPLRFPPHMLSKLIDLG